MILYAQSHDTLYSHMTLYTQSHDSADNLPDTVTEVRLATPEVLGVAADTTVRYEY